MDPKVQKIINRIMWSLLLLLIVYLLMVIWFNTKPIEVLQSTGVSKSFMKQMVAGNYEKAFDDVYDRETADSREYEASRAEWAANIQKWKDDGSYIVSYRDLKSTIDDTAVMTKAFVTISSKGREAEHWTGFYLYKKSDGSYGVEGLQFLNEELLDDGWEKLFRNLRQWRQ